MKKWSVLRIVLAGIGAGAVNGLFGAGGGMLLVPALVLLSDIKEESIFPCSVSIILPICVITLILNWQSTAFDFKAALPYLLGSLVGGLAAGYWGSKIPVKWLHRILGILILWGGIRYLC